MSHPGQESQSVYARAFQRDNYRCVYCDKDLLESLDSFAASHLDHLKPKAHGGPDDDLWNRVMSCSVCNSIKMSYDPYPKGLITTQEAFDQAVNAAKVFINEKRNGHRDCSYFRDWHHWLKRSGRKAETAPEGAA